MSITGIREQKKKLLKRRDGITGETEGGWDRDCRKGFLEFGFELGRSGERSDVIKFMFGATSGKRRRVGLGM